jgi:GcrA cell cycle regulator
MQSSTWAPEHSQALREYLAKGMPYSEIADATNSRFGTAYTRSATIGRGKRMGLAGPDRPEDEPRRPPKAKTPRLKANPSREYVDGVQIREPITEGQRKAVLRLNRAERELGADGSALVHDVLVQGMTMEQIGQRRGLCTQRWKDYFSRRFCECLDRLALIYGFTTERK